MAEFMLALAVQPVSVEPPNPVTWAPAFAARPRTNIPMATIQLRVPEGTGQIMIFLQLLFSSCPIPDVNKKRGQKIAVIAGEFKLILAVAPCQILEKRAIRVI